MQNLLKNKYVSMREDTHRGVKDLVFFEYLLPCNDNEAILEIRDLSGKLILQTAIDKSLRQYTLNVDKYVSGNYIYKIICGGTVFGKGQISVIK